jgi:hypothetical protein
MLQLKHRTAALAFCFSQKEKGEKKTTRRPSPGPSLFYSPFTGLIFTTSLWRNAGSSIPTLNFLRYFKNQGSLRHEVSAALE